MMIVMRTDATQEQIKEVVSRIKAHQMNAHLSAGEESAPSSVWSAMARPMEQGQFHTHCPVSTVWCRFPVPYKLASREFHPQDTIVNVNGLEVGGKDLVIIAGPCAVESKASKCWKLLTWSKKAAPTPLRGGAYKPRTSPYSFQGLGEEGLKMLAEARQKRPAYRVVTEVTAP